MRPNSPHPTPLLARPRRRSALALTGGCALTLTLLTGCGHSSASGVARTAVSAATSTTTATPAQTPTASPATTSGAGASTSPSAPVATVTVTRSASVSAPAPTASRPVIDASGASGIIAFSSPSGHIACDTSSDDGWLVRCDVEQARWFVPAAKQATCGEVGTMGSSAELPGVGSPYLFCQSDTVLGTTTRGSMGTEWVDSTPGAQWGTIRGQQQAVLPYDTTLKLPGGLSCSVQVSAGMTCSNASGHSFTVAMQGYHFN